MTLADHSDWELSVKSMCAECDEWMVEDESESEDLQDGAKAVECPSCEETVYVKARIELKDDPEIREKWLDASPL